MSRFPFLATAALLGMMMTSCAGMHEKMKPKAVVASGFLTHAGEMKKAGHHSPFLLSWRNPKPKAAQKAKLYVAPVSLAYLRPMSKNLASMESGEAAWKKGTQELAGYAHEQFVSTFSHSPAKRYEVVAAPGKDSQTLELAIVELNPNTISGSIVRNGVNAVSLPGMDLIFARASHSLKGNIAIEGRLRDSKTGEVLYEFADNEESKSAFIINVRDFTIYGQARLAMREWAEQLEQVLRVPAGTVVKDSSPMTFRLW